MTTIKLYDNDAYMTDFTATVIFSEGNTVILDQTAFFPEEGGQTPDRGTLTLLQSGVNDGSVSPDPAFPVLDVQIRKDGSILHTLDQPLPVGVAVKGSIDWTHRFSNMQNHTGEHIFSGLVRARFGFDNVGFHLSDNIVTMDYNGTLTEEEIRSLETETNRKIFEDHPVYCSYPSPEELASLDYRSKIDFTEGVRIVEIEDVDLCACCAPHVHSTAEVGLLKVVDFMNYKGGIRLTIVCGMRALLDFQKKHDDVIHLSRLLSVKPEEVVPGVERLKAEAEQTAGKLHQAKEALMEKELSLVPADQKHVCLFTSDIPNLVMRNAVNTLTETHEGFCAVFNGSDAEGYQFIIGSRTADCREMTAKLKELYNAKGGGKPEMVQGSVSAAAKDIAKLFI